MSENSHNTESGFWFYVENYFYHFIGFTVVVALLLLFHLRKKWVPRYRQWRYGYAPFPGGSFQEDIENGLSSSNFNLFGNLTGDSRKGLDGEAKKKIIEIMNSEGIEFDEARAKYLKKKMAENEIGPDGLPLDPRLVTFS